MGIYQRLHKDSIVAAPDFNRWRVPPASIAIHLCIGSVYAWSIFNPPLTTVLGVVQPAADDWPLEDVTRIAALHGLQRQQVVRMPANNLTVVFTKTL